MEIAGVVLSWVLLGGHRGQGAQPSPPQTPLSAASPSGSQGQLPPAGHSPGLMAFLPVSLISCVLVELSTHIPQLGERGAMLPLAQSRAVEIPAISPSVCSGLLRSKWGAH